MLASRRKCSAGVGNPESNAASRLPIPTIASSLSGIDCTYAHTCSAGINPDRISRAIGIRRKNPLLLRLIVAHVMCQVAARPQHNLHGIAEPGCRKFLSHHVVPR